MQKGNSKTYDIFLHVFLVKRANTFFQQLRILNVANTIVQIGLEATHHSLDITHLQQQRHQVHKNTSLQKNDVDTHEQCCGRIYMHTDACSFKAHPLSLLVELLVGGLELLTQLCDVELQLRVLLVESLQLALHLLDLFLHRLLLEKKT